MSLHVLTYNLNRVMQIFGVAPLVASRPHQLFTDGPVGPQLFKMTIPLVWGVLATMGAQVVITWCVGRLGVAEFAAIGFAFPIVMTVVSFGIGFAAGTSAAVAQDLGRGDKHGVAHLTTHAILIAGVSTALLSVIGILSIRPIFRAMGASVQALPLISTYMRIWYLGAPFYIASMVGLSALRAVGDSRFQGIAMVAAASLSAILAPFLILNPHVREHNGIAAAAFASNAPWTIMFVITFLRLKHMGMLDRGGFAIDQIANSSRRLMRIGLPAALTNIIIPFAAAIVTAFLAPFGSEAVAGFGIATRFEAMTLCAFLALSAVMNPFAGQNFGAARPERIRIALRLVVWFCIGWGTLLAIALGLSARHLSAYFSANAEVARVAAAYWYIVPVSYGASGVIMCVNAIFNGLSKPLAAVSISAARVIGVNIPIAWIGAHLLGSSGVFFGISVANFIVGIAATIWVRRALANEKHTLQPVA